MASLRRKPKPNGERGYRSPYWYATLIDRHGKRVEWCTKKTVKADAWAQAIEWERAEKDARERGESEAVEPDPGKPVAEAVAAYLAEFYRVGTTKESFRSLKTHVRRVVKGCGFERLKDFKKARLEKFLGECQAEGLAVKTVNRYRDVAVRLVKFCVGEGWLKENPLKAVRRSKGPGKKPRRAFTEPELGRFLAASEDKRRHLVYRVAILSGLRIDELRKLERQDFSLGERPRWHLRPAITKSKRLDLVPMLPQCAELLAPHAGLSPGARLFRKAVPRCETFDLDLAAAGIAKVDEAGRHLNFHCLRYTFCTLLSRRNMPIQHVKRLMRHKNIKETCDLYSDLGIEDTTDEVGRLPRFDSVALSSSQEEE